MPWSTTRTPGTQAKYRTVQHRREREARMRTYKREGYTICAQPVCVMPTRTITYPEPVHLGHDETGQSYIGLVHPLCNVTDGAKRGNERSRGIATDQRDWHL